MATALLSVCFLSSPPPSHWSSHLPSLPESGAESSRFRPIVVVPSPAGLRRKPCSASGNGRNADESPAGFFDEDGVVKDMDAYLNHLSLEYESVWDTKPSWCQPWTITLTGVLITLSSWVILHSVVATSVVGSLICAWWYIFLYSYPKAYSAMIEERRRNVSGGIEDTYGVKKNQ